MPLAFYKCSECKAVRETYEEALACEKSHLAVVSVKKAEYRFGPYPFRVVLTFPDGKECEYLIED